MDRGKKHAPALTGKVRMGLFELTMDPSDDASVEQVFDGGASLQEGIAGRKTINTKYENNLPLREVRSRSVMRGG